MADTYSPLLRLRLQQTGANTNTWGAHLNAAALLLVENAIAGAASITVAASDVTLSTVNGGSDQARVAVLKLVGSPGASRNIIIPALSKPYIVKNETGHSQTIKTATGTGLSVPHGGYQQIYCDGEEVFAVAAANAGFVTLEDAATVTVDCATGGKFIVTIDDDRDIEFTNPSDGQEIELWIQQDNDGDRAVSWPANVQWDTRAVPRLSTAANAIDRFALTYNADEDVWTGYAGVPIDGFYALTDAATIAVPCDLASKFIVQLGGNRALTLDDPRDGQSIEIWFVQDAAGGRTLSWPASVRFASGTSALLSTGAFAIDVYRLTYSVDAGVWVADGARNASAASGAGTYDITIAGGTDQSLFHLVGSPSGIVTVNVTVEQGTVLVATSTANGALDTSGFASGSIINLYNTNGGFFIGRGGDGGDGGESGGDYFQQDQYSRNLGKNGRAGGPAIIGPGSGRTLNVYNGGGYIWGGGGGGGGGDAQPNAGVNASSAGGGGGGGAGGGRGGSGGVTAGGSGTSRAGDGTSGGMGPNAFAGTAGAGASNSATGYAGGNGGEWGEDGSDGSGGSGGYGTGGSGGPAIYPNGATVNILSGSGSPNIRGSTS